MEEGDETHSSSFPAGNTAQERSLSYVPQCYMVPPSYSPSLDPEIAHVRVIDLAGLHQGREQRAVVVKDIGNACRFGFFRVVNHGISQMVLDEALCMARGFFDLPTEERMKFVSNDVHKPVRYGISFKNGQDKVQFWRIFLKHYAHPLEKWLHLWPNNPPNYREKMGKYCQQVRKLALDLMEAITESLGLGQKYLSTKMEQGMQVMAVNCYPPCPNPKMALGLPPHSDYSCLSIVLQSTTGLEIMDMKDQSRWKLVPDIKGTLLVHVGDHVEVLSNGIYKSIVHRATLNSLRTRTSIASLHSMALDEVMEPANELVDEANPKAYKGSSFRDFLNFLSNNNIVEINTFMDTLKINK